MPVTIHGKEYKTVAERVAAFREKFPNWSINTNLIDADDMRVSTRTVIANEEGRVVSTGLAEERRDSSTFTKTSAMEVCETSSVGRALAFLGGEFMGTEIASADEVANAIHQQTNMNGSRVNISKLRAVVDTAIQIVDESGETLTEEDAAKKAREIYEPLSNDERMWVNGQIKEKKFKSGAGRMKGYWSPFHELLVKAAEIET
jgi:hypothetical protein